MGLKLTEDQLHEQRSDELIDALQYDTPDAVLACLRKLDRLDGLAFQVVLQQLEGTAFLKVKFRNRIKIVAPRGRPPSLAKEPAMRYFINDYPNLERKE
jgi:hypothetical protein